MTSLFEDLRAEPLSGLPVELVNPGGRGVELLEFVAVDARQGELGKPVDVANEAENASRESAAALRVMVDAARAESAAETRCDVLEECATQVREERLRVDAILREFRKERQQYFASAEEQVVRLALGVAARVLHREVLVDALHLRAAVGSALQCIRDGSASTLRVRAGDVAAWQELFGDTNEVSVTVVADNAAGRGCCLLETSVGRVDLAVAAQLGEVERTFRELLQGGC